MQKKNKWITKDLQKSLVFIFPYLRLEYNPCITTTFMGANYLEGQWGDKFIVEVNPSKDLTNYVRTLTNHPLFLEQKEIGPDKVHYIFSIPENIKDDVVTPFLNGKYSEMAEYHKNNGYYPKYLSDGSINPNYQILHKDPALKMVWEYLIGVPLGDQEVSSRPEKEDEIYEFTSGRPIEPVNSRTDNLD